ncbi:MAG TPA: HDOD domain-containing protein [Solirubrobacteraceae bacterium]|nr:HDOD domain-containing protein [Solirubrobacteraceae bacterium]
MRGAARQRSRAPLTAPEEERGGAGHLIAAIAALDELPALEESRQLLLTALAEPQLIVADVVAAIESDVALSIGVLRVANVGKSARRRIGTVPDALDALGAERIEALAKRVPTFGFFERSGAWEHTPEGFRLHALATQRAAGRVARQVGYEKRDQLAVAALLHDVGRLVLLRAYPGYSAAIVDGSATPQARLHRERRILGFDHAVVGGMLIRRWGLPSSLAVTVERHHDPQASVEAALIGLADMLAHYERGAAVDPRELLASAGRVGLGLDGLRRLLYDQPSAATRRRLPAEPCPLSAKELRVLELLAGGLVYKEIAEVLCVSVSTVRSHLHGIYRRLDVTDRAQAVITATKHGWFEQA